MTHLGCGVAVAQVRAEEGGEEAAISDASTRDLGRDVL